MASDVSSVTSHFSTAVEGFTTTTTSSILSAATEVPLVSVSGLTNGKIFVGIIEPGGVKQQTFTGTVDTSNSKITGVVWTRGTNTAHAGGVTVVDYTTGTAHNMMTKGILCFANQAGELLPAATVNGRGTLTNFAPAGMVAPYAGTSAPTGWLFCYGQAVSRTTYADLYAAVGTTYGVGDGSTTFNLPDLRGRVIAGKDDMGGSSANRLTNQSGGLNGDTLGATGGSETHTLTIAEMPSHQHTVTTPLGPMSDTDRGSASSSWSLDNTYTNPTSFTGGGGAHNNVQPTGILNYIIRT